MRRSIQGQAQILRTRSRSEASRGKPASKVRTTPAMSENTRLGNSFSRSSSQRCSCLVEFGRIGRQSVQANVLGHDQRFSDVGTRSINDHDDEVLRVCRTDLRQKASHIFGVHGRANHPIQLSLQRADRAINILELALVTVVHHRAQRGR